MDTENVSKASAGRICLEDDEQCLQVSGGWKIRQVGPRNERREPPRPGPLSPCPGGGDSNKRAALRAPCSSLPASVGEGSHEDSVMVARHPCAPDAAARCAPGLGHPVLVEVGAGQDAGAKTPPGTETLHLPGVGSGEGPGPGSDVAGPQAVPPGSPGGLHHPGSLALACQPNPGPDPGLL